MDMGITTFTAISYRSMTWKSRIIICNNFFFIFCGLKINFIILKNHFAKTFYVNCFGTVEIEQTFSIGCSFFKCSMRFHWVLVKQIAISCKCAFILYTNRHVLILLRYLLNSLSNATEQLRA